MSDAPSPDLTALRDELAEVDRTIVRLAARRAELATEIGRRKMTHGRGTRDFAQEKEVFGRARRAAEEYGLAPDVAQSLLVTLIEHSLTAQEQDRVHVEGSGQGRRVLIIGGAGKMGRWFARFLHSQGFAVEIADPAGPVEGFPHRDAWRAGSLDHEFIVVAAPLTTSQRILDDLAEEPPAGIVFDVASLKSPLRDGLRRLHEAGGRVTSMHPMFGPDTALLSGRHVIFVDVGDAEATRAVRSLFESTMAVEVDMDLESHDRLIAYILGLSHAVNIAFFTALAESGEAAPKLAELSSTTFDHQLEVARRVASENPHLYFEIQSANDYGTESLSALLYAVERMRSVVRAGDEAGFAALMRRGHDYLASVAPRPGVRPG